jgi:hypothetical protein
MTLNLRSPNVPEPEQELYENENKLPFFPLSYGKSD